MGTEDLMGVVTAIAPEVPAHSLLEALALEGQDQVVVEGLNPELQAGAAEEKASLLIEALALEKAETQEHNNG